VFNTFRKCEIATKLDCIKYRCHEGEVFGVRQLLKKLKTCVLGKVPLKRTTAKLRTETKCIHQPRPELFIESTLESTLSEWGAIWVTRPRPALLPYLDVAITPIAPDEIDTHENHVSGSAGPGCWDMDFAAFVNSHNCCFVSYLPVHS
jgi:hypothetical protein